jgi:uncharacterized protein (TIGR02145 family)
MNKRVAYLILMLIVVSCSSNSDSNPSYCDDNKSSYTTVTIGSQVWMQKNLNVCKFRNGDDIPQVQDPLKWIYLTTGAWCYYENNTANGIVYGKLYNWYAVNDSRGLAPKGYHIPTDAEFTVLTTFLGGESVAGGKMKESGTSHWMNPNFGATNNSGFTGIAGGTRSDGGSFNNIGVLVRFWSSTEGNAHQSWYRTLYKGNATAQRDFSSKNCGWSVRCLKD